MRMCATEDVYVRKALTMIRQLWYCIMQSVMLSVTLLLGFSFTAVPFVTERLNKKTVLLERRLRGRVSEGEMRNNRNIVCHQSIQLHDDILLSAESSD